MLDHNVFTFDSDVTSAAGGLMSEIFGQPNASFV